MIRTQIQLEEEQMQWLKKEANARGKSVSQLIREGIAIFQARESQIHDMKKERALMAVGRFASDLSDVSERHDEYLAIQCCLKVPSNYHLRIDIILNRRNNHFKKHITY